MMCLFVILKYFYSTASALVNIASARGGGILALNGSGVGSKSLSNGKGSQNLSSTGKGVMLNVDAVLACPLTQKPIPEAYVIEEIYSAITASLSYDKIPSEGGTVTPLLSYSQSKTTTWSDGRMETVQITSGATLEWNVPNGIVSAEATSFTDEQVVKIMTLKITLNGKTKNLSYSVKQEPYVEETVYYVGNVNTSSATFPQTDLTKLNEKVFSETEQTFVADKTCFVLMLPSNVDMASVKYTSSGITSELEKSDFNLVHDDVTLNGIDYKVYGYRAGSVSSTNQLAYKYTLVKV